MGARPTAYPAPPAAYPTHHVSYSAPPATYPEHTAAYPAHHAAYSARPVPMLLVLQHILLLQQPILLIM